MSQCLQLHDPCSQVCRAAGYYSHALFVAHAAGEPEWYLEILLDDCQRFDDALAYLQDLARQQAAAALKKYGKVGLVLCAYNRPAPALSVTISMMAASSGCIEDVWQGRTGPEEHMHALGLHHTCSASSAVTALMAVWRSGEVLLAATTTLCRRTRHAFNPQTRRANSLGTVASSLLQGLKCFQG